MELQRTTRRRILGFVAILLSLTGLTLAQGKGKPPVDDPPAPPDSWMAYTDGTSIYLTNGDESGRLVAGDAKKGPTYRNPTWSADGTEVACVRHNRPGYDLCAAPVDGSANPRVITPMPGGDYTPGRPDWSKGITLTGTEMILFSAYTPELSLAIYAVAPDGTGLCRLTLDDCSWASPVWSPDSTQFVAARMCPGDTVPFSLVICDVAMVGNQLAIVGTTPLTNIPGGPLEGQGCFWSDWSHDGEWIVAKVIYTIVRIRVDDPFDVVELYALPPGAGGENLPRFSPDDTRVIFDLEPVANRNWLHSVSAIDGSDLVPYEQTKKRNQFSVAVKP